MKLKMLLHIGLLAGCLTASGITALADSHRSPSAEGASISFANLAAGDEVPPGYIARFTIRGMGIAPAGSQVDNTGHFHLLIDLAELPPLDQPLPATEQIVHFGKGQTEAPLNLAAGQHRLQLLLADYAHVPHDPPVMSEVVTIVVATDAE